MNVFSKLVALKSSKKNPAPEIKTAVEAHKMDKPVKGDVNINDSVPATGNWFKPLGSADFSFQISRNPADDIINPALVSTPCRRMRPIADWYLDHRRRKLSSLSCVVSTAQEAFLGWH